MCGKASTADVNERTLVLADGEGVPATLEKRQVALVCR
jgi:hypothetical protein